MKVLGILGSPRRGGNSEALLERVLQGCRSAGVEVVSILAAELAISGCRECDGCRLTGECVVNDEMQRVFSLVDEAAAIVLATPVFFYGFPAQLKALVDRCQARWRRRRLTKTREQRKTYSAGCGFLVAVGGTGRPDTFHGLELSARVFYDALDRRYAGGLFFPKVDEKGSILQRTGALEAAYDLGRRIVSGQGGEEDPCRASGFASPGK